MYRYKVVCPINGSRWIEVETKIEIPGPGVYFLNFPAWRPGRYILQNFAQFAKNFKIYSENYENEEVKIIKIAKDQWKIEIEKQANLVATFQYYCTDINAGSSFVSHDLLYLNPINFTPYLLNFENQPAIMEVNIPEGWKVACSLPREGNVFFANDYHELVDSPLIASTNLHHQSHKVKNILFHFWSYTLPLSGSLIQTKFIPWIEYQIETMDDFPVDEYHFMYLFLPFKHYHGVEHLKSTVIVLGPATKFFNNSDGEDILLGISSHELFHVWNIKTIRPEEWLPYDYSREKFSALGILAEGITTFYGDYFLYRSGVWSLEEYLKKLSKIFQQHFDNHARLNMSVLEASIDTWLDGYSKSAPHRKVSIYNEGCLLAFILDTLLMKYAGINLDEVMRQFYQRAMKGEGIGYEVFKSTFMSYNQEVFENIFKSYIENPGDMSSILIECLEYRNWELQIEFNPVLAKRKMGMEVIEINGKSMVVNVYPESPAWLAGISENSIIRRINDIDPGAGFNEWFEYFASQKQIIEIEWIDDKMYIYKSSFDVEKFEKNYFNLYKIKPKQSKN